ncbi:efflux RND transporter periplasmic adaptor subunit [Phenylobacterium sp. LjRoot219]|uniref:efflux RND transporter periplasmic adaptor subunit n=1 Tax=Phenylobacterium sp. LjRoot219 TaxID=3342283 RepID=UPI003ECCA4E8
MDDLAAKRRLKSSWRVTSRRPWIVLLVLVLLGLAVWGAWALVQNAKSESGGPGGGFGRRGGRPPTTVSTAQASLADIPVTLDAIGTVTPVATVTVRPQVSGTITQILFTEGQMVKRGQTLAVIDPRPYEMQLMQAQGQLTRDEAQLANARLTLQRFRNLLAQDSIARQEVDTQAATVKQLEGTVLTDRAAVGTAKLNLSFTRVIAPVDGRVGLRAVDVGNVVAANDATGIVVQTQVTPIDVQFTVPQDQAPEVMALAAKGTLPVAVLDRTRSSPLTTGTFSTLDNQVDPSTGTVRAKARFGNGDGVLFPNQFVNVRVTLNVIRGAVVAPLTALRTGPNGDFVWIVKPDQTVTMRAVKRGQTTPTQVAILSGLTVGDKVVTEGGDRLTEGGRIMLPGQGGQRGRRGQAQAGPSSAAGADAGGGAPSPDRQAARAALLKACGGDIAKLCAGAEGREAMMCLRQHADQTSAGCQAALAKMPRRGAGPA